MSDGIDKDWDKDWDKDSESLPPTTDNGPQAHLRSDHVGTWPFLLGTSGCEASFARMHPLIHIFGQNTGTPAIAARRRNLRTFCEPALLILNDSYHLLHRIDFTFLKAGLPALGANPGGGIVENHVEAFSIDVKWHGSSFHFSVAIHAFHFFILSE